MSDWAGLAWLFVLLLAPEAFLPIRQVGVQFHAAAEGVAATEDVFDVLDAAGADASTVHNSGASGAPSESGAVAVPVVDSSPELRTEEAGGLVVEGLRVRELPPVSFTAAPGTVTLIEGPSGSGKSSLLAALRGAAVFEGTATWTGQDVRGLAPSDWLAWAGQAPGLMRGTVADNVALGDPAPDAVRVRAALDAACADGISADRVLGVQGSGLSGGQAQRVAVARALYREGPGRLLALDEPSSALDPETEERLWRSLRERADAGATIVLVSHRRSARDIADRVVALGVSA